VETEASHVGFNTMEYFSSLFNAMVSSRSGAYPSARALGSHNVFPQLFGWTPEAFPVEVRGSATGLLNAVVCFVSPVLSSLHSSLHRRMEVILCFT
jgi:hypothetical protein